MSITIPQDNTSITLFSKNLFTDLHTMVKKRAPKIGEMTNEQAIKVLKQAKFEADVKAFFSKPIVVIVVGVLLAVAGATLAIALAPAAALTAPPLTVGSVVLKITAVLFGGIVGLGIKNSLFNDDALPLLSKAYSAQSQLASRYIEQLETAKSKVKIQFAT